MTIIKPLMGPMVIKNDMNSCGTMGHELMKWHTTQLLVLLAIGPAYPVNIFIKKKTSQREYAR